MTADKRIVIIQNIAKPKKTAQKYLQAFTATKGAMVQILELLKKRREESALCTLLPFFQQMLKLFTNNKGDEITFMDTCLAGLMTALKDDRCSPLLEARFFAFGTAGKPLPVYQLRAKVLDRNASPF